VSTKGVLIFSVIFLILVALIARFAINWVILKNENDFKYNRLP
jgi:hypothetical protein